MGCKAVYGILHNGKEYAPGDPIAFRMSEEALVDRLYETGAIKGDDPYEDEVSPEKLLAKMNKGELTLVATGLGIEIPDGATNAAIAGLIETKRAEVAGSSGE